MRRLYIGGLSHSVTQKDLKDRFGKFGDVQDVELRTRRDEEGVPYKTFGYINIDISDADLKKCLTVLNKSKWKGGTLQIETAKESFLHRLSEEQQAAREQRLHPPAAEDKTQKLLDSLSKAGVDNFTMKAAVPGTEIPGHKEWVVSKFGRVLPVLQLRYKKGNKARTLKYDPSKYSHNIRRLDRGDIDQPTPVAQLTWEVQGGDDDISKKRRGEFPPYEPPRTKRRFLSVPINPHHFTNGFKPLTNHRPAQRKWTPLTDSDVDSDEEIRRLVAAQDTSHSALYQEVREDNLEVVGLDYLVKPQQKGNRIYKEKLYFTDDYDSADTDELFASRKPLPPPPSLQEKPPAPTKSKAGLKEEEEEDDSLESADSDSCSDSDYEAMFSNVTCLEISLADLQRIAEDSQQTSETTVPSIPGDTETMSGPSDQPAPKKGTLPEDILASIMEDDSSDDEKKKKKKRKAVESTPLPAFLGTKTLNEGSETNNAQKQEKGRGSMGKKLKLDSEAPQVDHRGAAGKANRTLSEEKPPETEEMTTDSEQDEEEAKVVPNKAPKNAEKTTSSSSGSDDDIEDNEKKIISAVGAKKTGPVLAPHTESSSSEEEEEEEEEKQAPSRVALGPKEEEEMQKKANTRRLAAIQQRMKEAEEHKKLIQGALANLLFGGSEDEEDGDEEGDNSRFDIRPQFEGRAGQKLMALQSRFGTDERFRMDSRFLEEDEEDKESGEKEDEDLEQERKKNLSILQSVLGSSQQTYSSKTASKAKNFRDVSALHYDPSKEEHAVFETITDEAKESKSARRKKREEAQKLPEVSKEIYYDVSGDLKAVFGQTKDDVTGGEENTNWDQEEEEEEEEEEDKEGEPTMSSLILTHPTTKNEESSGFKFSFFGDDTEMESKETDYKVESIQAPKVSWQQDPRFHDSSEEEDEDSVQNKENTSKTDVSFFFFHPEDTRLTEGPRLFFRSTQLEDQREQWEERRTALRQEYRKKHKDARRKLKSTLKS
uniref:Nucleolar protein 8 n=1 Tax=Echeneis naucrates TaxID=173247 RepID=A0A665VE08_ECHNA